tara:strand:+ start:24815 stop:25531 length:717 start_codon:yes stop_codon:yes gene_type:complete
MIMRETSLRTPVTVPLRQQVVEILRDAIIDNKFEPGGRLRERELCEMLGVSRSTIREGLRQLESEGLIAISPNKGPMVTNLSEEEARHIYAVRARLQGMAAELCASNTPPDLISRLEQFFSKIKEAISNDDADSLLIARTGFYNEIFDGTGNPYLALILRQMRARVTLMRGHDGLRQERMEETLRGATQVLDAIRACDPKTAKKVAQEHIHRAGDLLFEAHRATLLNSKPDKKRRTKS